MKRVEFMLEFVTPGFLGGADNKTTSEWRAQSIRGQLRWWIRAVAGGFYKGDIAKVRTVEDTLFGTTSLSSAVRVIPTGPPPKAVKNGGECVWGNTIDENGLAGRWGDSTAETKARLKLRGKSNSIYYLGYGVIVWNKEKKFVEYVRSRIEAGNRANFILQIQRPASECFELLAKSVRAWLFLGGIGAKSRKGFGSMCCTDVSNDILGSKGKFIPSNIGEFKEGLKDILEGIRNSGTGSASVEAPCEWSHFSPASMVCIGKTSHNNWVDAMMATGSWLIAFRRRYGYPNDARTWRGNNIGQDYDWAAPNGSKRRGNIPDRSGFGLPLPFGMGGETVTWMNVGGGGKEVEDNRRASPLLIHIAKLGKDYYPIFTFLPARLVPEGAMLGFKNHSSSFTFSETSNQRSVGRHFLDDLVVKKLVEEVR
ncbi:MAG: type III-B CRISPR module RAMP protein Cmr1 [Deltaproteobacteria bacterium]|nr:type III-B CRISPR module RAMP protein Cmr1 [Deltaproteobacteria bacterium]